MSVLKLDAKQEIKDRLDLADLISEHLRLQKAGRDLKGLCPFHQEKTPSFYVSPEKQLWHCYGCGKGGDLFTFVMEIEHLDFRGALRLLAVKVGVELDESEGSGRRRELQRVILQLNQLAAKYFHHVLLEQPAGLPALMQLEARGITRASMAEFGLGFAPAARRRDNLVRFLRKHGIKDADMVEAGLAVRPSDGERELWDRFRQRIMIPIHDERGELIAFGGRVLDEAQQPKYLNTSQTALYDKGRTLFNLFRARKAIHEAKHAVLMEGYFDAITAWQHGVQNVVTTSGTALTEHQVRLLKRETQELVLAFDRDDAGRMATQRAIELAARSGIHIKVVRVPDGKDPDDYLRKHPQGWAALVERAVPEWEYLLRQALDSLDLTDADDRRRGAEAVIPVLAQIPESSVKEIYAQQAAGWLRIDASALLRDASAPRRQDAGRPGPRPLKPAPAGDPARAAIPPGSATPRPPGSLPATRDEGYLLGLLLARPDLVPSLWPDLAGIEFSNPAYAGVFQRLTAMAEADRTVRPLDRLEEFPAEEQRLLAAAALRDYPELDEGSEVALAVSLAQSIQTLEINAGTRRLRALKAELGQPDGDPVRRQALAEEIDRLARRLDALKGVRGGG
ncbi:MAG TPA: DNA primase [Candidatus Limnocylindrales bacterium]|nr:DNA primase [Candidatus Limnocylindrales bacterium]